MADYWIKWYHEILDDPKMATLPDRLWRRFSELCLLAGRMCKDKSGQLSDTRQIAWALRMNMDELQLDLTQLHAAKLIEPIPNGWVIVNFAKRQRAASSTERVQQFRKRQQRDQYNGTDNADETDQKRKVTQINRLTEYRLTETETDSELNTTTTTTLNAGEQNQSSSGSRRDDAFALVVRAYEQNIGILSPGIAEKIGADVDDYGPELCAEAIGEAVRQNIRRWSYVQGILRNWKRNGKGAIPVANNGKSSTKAKRYEEVWENGERKLREVDA